MKGLIIRPQELAEKLSISVATLYRMKKAGELPPQVKIHERAVGWKVSDIEEWLDNRKVVESQIQG